MICCDSGPNLKHNVGFLLDSRKVKLKGQNDLFENIA